MDRKGHKKRHKSSTLGSSPAVVVSMAMLKIVVPLIVITVIAVWFLTYKGNGSGAIRVTTSIPGADIYIAGTMTGYQSDTTLHDIPAGRNIITVHKSGYVSEPEMIVAEVKKGKVVAANFVLKDAQAIEHPDTIPPLRNVRQEIFSTGMPVESVPPSSYRSRTNLLDYSSRVRSSGLESRAPAAKDVLTSDVEPSGPAAGKTTAPETQITVSSIPDGAHITVNGNATKRTTPYTFRGLDYGMYVFHLSKPGYVTKPDSIIVQLTPDDESELVAFNLAVDQSLPKPTLTVTTSPPAASVRIDGHPAGVGNATTDVSFGTHTVEFSEVPGYRTPEKQTVNVTASDPHPTVTGTYEKLVGNSYLAVLPSEDVGVKFEGTKLRVYVDNELLVDGPKQPFNATLIGRIPAGKRLVRVQYDDLVDDLHVNVEDGTVSEVTFRIESFFSKRKLRLRERDSMPLDKWEQKTRRLTVLTSS